MSCVTRSGEWSPAPWAQEKMTVPCSPCRPQSIPSAHTSACEGRTAGEDGTGLSTAAQNVAHNVAQDRGYSRSRLVSQSLRNNTKQESRDRQVVCDDSEALVQLLNTPASPCSTADSDVFSDFGSIGSASAWLASSSFGTDTKEGSATDRRGNSEPTPYSPAETMATACGKAGAPWQTDFKGRELSEAQRKDFAAAAEAADDAILTSWCPADELRNCISRDSESRTPKVTLLGSKLQGKGKAPQGSTMVQDRGILRRIPSTDKIPSSWRWEASDDDKQLTGVALEANKTSPAVGSKGIELATSATADAIRAKFGLEVPSNFVKEMETLIEMGYSNTDLCLQLLTQYDGSLLRTLSELERRRRDAAE